MEALNHHFASTWAPSKVDPKDTSLKDIALCWPTKEVGPQDDNNGVISYTSLIDIIHDVDGHDLLNISIKNQLVKQAALAYLQSTMNLPTQNQNCMERLWRKVMGWASVRCIWPRYVSDPLQAFLGMLQPWLAKLACRAYHFRYNAIKETATV